MDIEQHSSFKYKPLEVGEFRVLDLCCSPDASAEIQCRLIQEQLAGPGLEPYDAISYTWGSDLPSKSILLNDSDFMVRENLYHALRCLRQANEDQRIWIDALCIDQSNIAERNSQVAQMRDIFANAREVAIWLGEDPTGARQFGFEEIPRLLKSFSTPGWADSEEGLKRSLADENFLRGLDCVSWVFEDRWWRRIWVIQEVAVAKSDPTLFSGTKSIGWSTLFEFLFAFDESHALTLMYERGVSARAKDSLARLSDGLGSLLSIGRVRYLYSYENQQPLGNLLITGSRYHCTDPRDKVFALLGIMNGTPPFQADYNQSQRWVNVSTMAQLLLATQDLRGLSWITGALDEQREPTLPSWVSDFCGRTKTVNTYFPISTDNKAIWEVNWRAYSAGLNCDGIAPRFEEEGEVLVVRGLQVDSIDRLGSCSRDYQYMRSGSATVPLTPTLRDWRRVAGFPIDQADYHNSEQHLNFWRTILLDRNEFALLSHETMDDYKRLGAGSSLLPRTVDAEEKLVTKLELTPGPHFGKRFIITSRGSMGLGPGQACVGDQVCIFVGGEVPYIVRPVGEGYYKLIGECYIQGIMDGEAIEDEKRGKFYFADFRIK